MFITIQAENGPRNGKFNQAFVQDWLNKDGSIDYGPYQVIQYIYGWYIINQKDY